MSNFEQLAESRYPIGPEVKLLNVEGLERVRIFCVRLGWERDLDEILAHLAKVRNQDERISGCARLQTKVGGYRAGLLYVTQCESDVRAELLVAVPEIGHEKRADGLIESLFTDLKHVEGKTAFKVEP